jgi:CheY-like chemotaxis protein
VKILLAEDEPTSRLVAQVTLRDLGYECHTVTDGAQAWDAFRRYGPDVGHQRLANAWTERTPTVPQDSGAHIR